MKPILYWYPVVYLDEDDPEDSVVVRDSGKIIPLQLSQEPYEVNVEARGSSFHMIFGSQINGMFLCIPNWNIGCELSRLSDRDWNMNSLLKTDSLDYEEATAIIWALYSIGDLLRLIH